MNTRTPYLIYSVFQNNKTSNENFKNHEHEKQYLKNAGVKFKELKRVYNGVSELSLMVCWNSETLEHVEATAKLYDQESYLHSDTNGIASLFDKNGSFITRLGKFQKLTAKEALKQDHNLDIENEVYFNYA
jgi:hypothetical protein